MCGSEGVQLLQHCFPYFYLRRFSESRSSSGSTPSVRPSVRSSVRPSVRNTFGGYIVCVICNSNSFHFLYIQPIFYGDLVYKFKRIVGKPNFSDQFKKIVKRYIRVGYNLDIMRQSACLVLNPITVYSYGFLFNCTTVGQASDSMTALT